MVRIEMAGQGDSAYLGRIGFFGGNFRKIEIRIFKMEKLKKTSKSSLNDGVSFEQVGNLSKGSLLQKILFRLADFFVTPKVFGTYRKFN